MEPKRFLDNGTTRMVELDTGTYRVGEFYCLEFKVSDRPVKDEVLDLILADYIYEAITMSHADGREFVYLGRQTQQANEGLDGCLIFAYPGNYELIAPEMIGAPA